MVHKGNISVKCLLVKDVEFVISCLGLLTDYATLCVYPHKHLFSMKVPHSSEKIFKFNMTCSACK